MTIVRLAVPSSPEELLLWSHVGLLWVVVNYVHRLDPLGQTEARALAGATLTRWRVGVAARAAAGAFLVTGISGYSGMGVGLGVLFFVGAAALPLMRVRWMRTDAAMGRDFRAEWELAVNAFVLAGSAFLIAASRMRLSVTVLELPAGSRSIVVGLLVTAGALFLLRGGTHVVRGVLEKTDTLPEEIASSPDDDPRHGVTIGNIERLLIYLFALTGSYAAIGLVIAAKGVVRAVEWRDRALVEYFLIGTLVSAGLAAVLGTGLRWSFAGF